MMNVCAGCGKYHADKEIDPTGPYAICPDCGHRHAFRRLPLLVVAGASGAGKSTVGRCLIDKIDEAIVLDADILWRPEFDTPEDGYNDFFETWLRLCKNISQSGMPVVLLCAGGIPEKIEGCVERRYFSDVHYLALTSEEADLADRLRRRPAWRGSHDEAYIRDQVRFNRWLKEIGPESEPPIELVNTTGVDVEATADAVAAWIRNRLADADLIQSIARPRMKESGDE
jgi:DNA-directed RNA polymerase subunit RPC12/RpoP